MKIQLHPETITGVPICGCGLVLEAHTAAELVDLMRCQSPFALAMTPAEYRETVIARVEGPDHPPLDADHPDEDFLHRLAARQRLQFIPEPAN